MECELSNYLLKLDEIKYVNKGPDNIRVYSIGEIVNKIFIDLKKFESKENIEKITKRCSDTHSNWILERTGISIQEAYNLCKIWKKSCKKSEKDFMILWEEIYKNSKYFGCTNGKKIKLPKSIDKKLAYLLGVIMGDGHLANPNKSYDKKTSYNSELRITDGYKETFVALSGIFEELFDYKPKIYSELSKVNRLFYRFVIKSKPLHRFIMNICEVPTGAKFDKVDIPQIIRNCQLDIQKSFISGFFDADGCIRLANKKFPMISIAQKNPKILYSIIEVSKKLNLSWSGPYKSNHPRNQGYQIRITNKDNVERFLKEFPPFNPIKIKQSEIIWKILKSQPTSQFKWMEIGDGEEKIKETRLKAMSKVEKH